MRSRDAIGRGIRLGKLIQQHQRIKVTRIMEELDMPSTTVYRYLDTAREVFPLVVINGVVIRAAKQESPSEPFDLK